MKLIDAALLSVMLAGSAMASPLPESAPIPGHIAPGTTLVVGDPQTRVALTLSGELERLPFKVEWANISGGPQTIEAFRAKALDIGSVADIPPIHAQWTGLDVKIVAAKFRLDPVGHPIYVIATAPGSGIEKLEDLKGKKVAFSPGQAQGALVLRLLKKLNLAHNDVQLVELPSVGDAYVNALASKLVDVAPIAEANKQRFVQNYARDGAKALPHGLRDDPAYLYVVKSSLEDANKAAAVRAYVQAWGRATRWIEAHPDEWIKGYYVKDQGLKPDAGRFLVESNGKPDVPLEWGGAIERQQETIDLLAAELRKPVLKAEALFDRRFEKVAGAAYLGE
ncbi:PhnD/SsuA/transferrin family substrate-binding protein [Bosea sp. F3-2]|uniref:ABC transporter substrate-binding protein n=1 Tax=Bosea sp. F3-2 TaxID=2599640 RepID=UPI0011F02F55|nr:ABC transporter substrate-binding protein [Bosea sp. F3-2]QEL22475.1 PhnD/SsuA/transferrin family substrate-binding protein [Bosea sp. F3-2]